MRPRFTRRNSVRLAAALAAALAVMAAVAVTGIAAASAATASVPRYHSGNTVGPFAAQARAARLSAPQQATLQGEVNKIIARYGGRQVALNEIALPHGASVLFPLPGQRVAHILPGTPQLPVSKVKVVQAKTAVAPAWSIGQRWYAPDGASCPYYYFCSWQGQSFTGIQWNVSQCGIWQEYPGSGWDGYGSWANNQSTEPTDLGDANKGLLYQLSDHFSSTGPNLSTSFNWGPIWYVMACPG